MKIIIKYCNEHIYINCAHELTGVFDAALFPLLVFLSVLVAVLGGVALLEGLRSLILDLKLFVIPLLHEKDRHIRILIVQC